MTVNRKTLILVAVVLIVGAKFALGLLDAPRETPSTVPGSIGAAPTPSIPNDGLTRVVPDAVVLNFGRVHSRGPVDLGATIERIRAGGKHPHRNDGSVFGNRERRLPQRERGYYREYVHPTDGIDGPGPQRIVVGRGGDWWYTPDHYDSFVSLGTQRRP